MSHRLQNTRVLNFSKEIKKINNRGVARTTANIYDGALCNNNERLENNISVYSKPYKHFYF